MPRLPLRPAVFIPVYVGLAFGPSVAMSAGGPVAGAAAMVAALVALALHADWVFRSIDYVAATAPARLARPLELARLAAHATGWCGGLAIAHAALAPFVSPTGETILGPAVPWLLLVAVLGFLTQVWIASRLLCDAEAGGRAPLHALVGTVLLFLYLAIGAPFLFRRLKALAAPKPSLAAQTA